MRQLKKRLSKLVRTIEPDKVPLTIRVVFVDADGTEAGFKEFTVGGRPKPVSRS